MKRKEILEVAIKTVTEDRNNSYGEPEDNFNLIASLWENYLNAGQDPEDCRIEITAEDVARMMILLKVARGATGRGSIDTWIDICGYSSCGGEIESKHTVTAPNKTAEAETSWTGNLTMEERLETIMASPIKASKGGHERC